MIVFLGFGITKAGNKVAYGLNLHYIPPKARKDFLEELLKLYASNKRFNSKTRLKIDWTKVKNMRGADLMIKAYLPNHIKGSMLEIHPRDWATALRSINKFLTNKDTIMQNRQNPQTQILELKAMLFDAGQQTQALSNELNQAQQALQQIAVSVGLSGDHVTYQNVVDEVAKNLTKPEDCAGQPEQESV